MSTILLDSRSRRGWNVASATLGILYVLSLLVFALSVFDEGLVSTTVLAAYTDEKSWWPIMIQVTLGIAAFATYYWPRRQDGRNFTVPAAGGLPLPPS